MAAVATEAPVQQEFAPEADIVVAENAAKHSDYKLVETKSGKLHVETKEYDPLERHRPTSKTANRGQGLAFMLPCCFAAPEVKEVEREGYELPPQQ